MTEHRTCDAALATANNNLENALTTNRALVAALEKIRDSGCTNCGPIAHKALTGE